MSNYLSIEELKAFVDPTTGEPFDLSDWTDEELQPFIDEAESIFEKLTGNRFGPFREVWIIDGTGEPALTFPPAIQYKLCTPEEVLSLNADATTHETLVENTDFINRGHYLLAGVPGITSDSFRDMILMGGIWTRGLRNYKVTGVWGMLSVPPSIKRLLSLYTLELLQPGLSKLDSGDVSRFKLGDYEVAFRSIDEKKLTSKDLTGFPMIDRILKHYVMYSSMFMNQTQFAYQLSSTYIG